MKKLNNCPICFSKEIINDFIEEKDGNYSKCPQCETLFVNPLVNYKEAVKRLSDTEYSDFYYSRKNEMQYRIRPSKKDFLKIKKYLKFGKMCDVGSASGLNLDLANDFDFESIGIEPNPNMIIDGKKHYGDRWIPLTLDEALAQKKIKISEFDLVTFFDVIEHLPDPISTISQSSRVLKKNGILFIRIPNQKYFLLKAKLLSILHGKKMVALDPLGHLFYFEHNNFLKIVREKNFEIVEYYSNESESLSLTKKGFLRLLFAIIHKFVNGLNQEVNFSYILRKK